MSTFSNHWNAQQLFFKDEALLGKSSSVWSVSENAHNSEPRCIFGPNFGYLSYQHCPATGMQNGDEALPSISSTGRGQMLITLEPHGIF